MTRWMRQTLWAALAVAGPAVAELARAEDAPSTAPQRIVLTTKDGVNVVGDYYAPQPSKKKAPCAILIHMYPATRTSWQPLVPSLHAAGFAVFAYDIRGTGESIGPKEKERYLKRWYSDRDGEHFSNAYQDTVAAADWLTARAECDATRTILIGASVGCSISIDVAARDGRAVGVICLSPGVNYMGLDSRKHIRKMKGRPVLLVAPQAERSDAETLAKLCKSAQTDVRPGGKNLHGTNMFSADYATDLMARITDFARDAVKAAAKSKKPKAKAKE